MAHLRRVAIILAPLTVLAISSLPTGSIAFAPCDNDRPCPSGFHCAGINPNAPGMCVPEAYVECSKDKPCPKDQHCAGINPNAPGVCIGNWPKEGQCSQTKDCPEGFHCAGINPNAPGMCVADWAAAK